MSEEQDYVIVWEAPKLIPPEFRLYYDDKGAVVCYTGDTTIEGKYIVIDAMTFAEARSDLRIIDGKISRAQPNSVVYKLMPSDTTGVACHIEDISILVDEAEEHTKWKLNIYELQ